MTQAILLAVAVFMAPTRQSKADEIAEFLFWHEMGNAAGLAAQSYADYQSERQLWREKIAAARAALERCGGCASARAELEKWQRIEDEFHQIVGGVFVSVGMPPIVAQALGIKMPMAPRRTPREWAQMCEIVRRDWIDQRPDVCRAAAEQHLTCLRNHQQTNNPCSWQQAEAPGGQCWDTKKLSGHCYSEDYDSFEREKRAQAARASGAILPEYVQPSTTAIVLYGAVPDDFMPKLPPVEAVEAKLNQDTTSELRFVMKKAGLGKLGEIAVKELLWQDFLDSGEARDKCIQPDATPGELEKRVCEDLMEMTWRYHAKVLSCYYALPRALTSASLGDANFWYGTRPEGADPAKLLQRSHRHPLLKVGEPRTDCPATIEEARQIAERHGSAITRLSAQVPETPHTVALRSEWHQQRQTDYEARNEAELVRKLASFPIEGAFSSSLATNFSAGSLNLPKPAWSEVSECIAKRIDQTSVRFDCTWRSATGRRRRSAWGFPQTYTATGTFAGSRLVVRWRPDLNLSYTVGSCGSQPCLQGQDAEGPIRRDTVSGTLMRESDLGTEAFAELISGIRIEGHYDLALSVDGTTTTLPCRIERDVQAHPHRFPTTCFAADGQAFKGFGNPDRSTMQIDWPNFFALRTPLRVNDRNVTHLRIRIDRTLTGSAGALALEGYGENGVSARLARADARSSYGFGTPLEELPELKRGKYAATLQAKGITSLETFAALSDEDAKTLGAGWLWRRDLARQFIKTPADARNRPAERDTSPAIRSPAAAPQTQVRSSNHPPDGRCTAESIAGTYRSIAGDIICKPVGSRLECCYGGASCQKLLHLGVTANGRGLSGEWEHRGRQKGPAEFALTDKCELSDGRWGFAANRMNNWKVVGRK
jgi:hypothetical protein